MFKYLIILGIVINCALSASLVAQESNVKTATCDTCVMILNTTKHILSQNVSEVILVESLSIGLCVGFGPFFKGCSQYVKEHAPIIIANLLNGTDPLKVCDLTIFCPARSKVVVEEPKSLVGNGTLCDTCELALNTAKSLLANNVSETDIVEYLSVVVCFSFGPFYKGCHEYIKKNGPVFLTKLANGINATLICEASIFCPSRSIEIKSEVQLRSITCDACTLALNTTKYLLAQNVSQVDIVSYLSVVICVGFGPFYKGCHDFIQKNGPGLIANVSNGINPDKICHSTIFCPSNQTQSIKIFTKQSLVGNGTLCDTCELALNTAKSLLANNVSETDIVDYLSVVICIGFGPFYKGCHEYVQKNGPVFLTKLANGINATLICEASIFCPSYLTNVKQETKSIAQLVNLNKPKAFLCEICTETLTDTKTILAQNETSSEVTDFISTSLCTHLGPFSDACRQYIDSNVPEIVQKLSDDIDPETICKQLFLCQ